jgi:hypothetical protein
MGIPVFLITLVALIVICIPAMIIEDNQVRLFAVRWYKAGWVVFRNAITVPGMQAELLIKEVYTKDEGVYHFADDGNIYFRSISAQKIWRLRTPLSFKCTGSLLNTETVEITARLPVAASVLFISFMILGLFFSIGAITTGFYFLFIPLGIFLFSYFMEKARLRTMLSELKYLLTKGN